MNRNKKQPCSEALYRWILLGGFLFPVALMALPISTKSLSSTLAQKKKPVSKDSEFNDPLLEEEESFNTLEEESKAVDSRFAVEENDIPEKTKAPEPSEEPVSTEDKIEDSSLKKELSPSDSTGDASNMKSSSKEKTDLIKSNEIDEDALFKAENETVNPDVESKPVKDSAKSLPIEKTQTENVVVDSEIEAMVDLGSSSKTAALPRWNPHDPHKGFLRVDEEGGYLYKENSPGFEKEITEPYKVVPKASNYKKGLLFVSSDGSYVYSGTDSELEGSASVRFAMMDPLPLENTYNLTFADIYGDQQLGVALIDYDWLAFRKFGHWVLSLGTGIGMVNGAGRFIDDQSEANEKYTLLILLNHISLVYRFQVTPHPWIVPYITAGAIPSVLYEHRDDNKRNKYEVIPAVQASGGLRLNIGRLDSYGAASLDSEYGINNLWLDVEYRRVQSLDTSMDISSNLFNAGLGFDF